MGFSIFRVMARTRGGGNSERLRPTASIRRQRGGSSIPRHVEQEEEIIPDVPGSEAHDFGGDGGYSGGPVDTSLLRSYGDHVARHLWDGKVSMI